MPHLLLLLCLFQLVHSVLLPGPSGPCQVQTKSSKLVDTARADPFSRQHDARAIMVSSFAPVHCGEVRHTPYVPPRIAHAAGQKLGLPNGTLNVFELASYAPSAPSPSSSHRNNITDESPVILFSPGLGSSRLIYANLLEQVASHGFVVVSLDHPHDAGAVEFPNGQIVPMASNVSSNIPLALETRVADVTFALDRLHNDTRAILPSAFHAHNRSLPLDRVAVIGHSLGGATAAQAMLDDERFVGGINFDGEMFGSVVKQGLDRPFVNFGEAQLQAQEKRTWKEFWSHLRGFKLELQLHDSKHLAFSDLPLVFDSTANATALRNATADHLGPLPGLGRLPGLRVKAILSEYITVACRFFVQGRKSALLDGPSRKYPEVMYISR